MLGFKVEGEKKYVMEAGVEGVCELSFSLSLQFGLGCNHGGGKIGFLIFLGWAVMEGAKVLEERAQS